ncbi:MAG TPA: ABC transporter permease [Candidatus Limnocylindria bacterium]|jgi:ABC-2 type transport system permease protein|nr:ABC transporter permease [Candidatus Limnocylindria bacterium]
MTTAAQRGAAVAAPVRRVAGGGLLGAIYIVWWRDVLRYWRDRARVGASLAQPLLYLVIFGTGLASSLGGGFGASGGATGVSYVQFIYPGVISMSVLFTAIFGAMSIVWDREFGFMRELLVAPIDRAAIAIGKTLGGATQAMIQGLILLVLAPFVGVSLDPVLLVELIALVFVLAFGLSAMGVALASGMRSMQGFQVVMNFLMMPMFFLSGALFPLVGLPGWMTVLTRLDPASYGVDPIRRVLLGSSGIPVDRFALTLFDRTLAIPVEAAIVIAFGLVMLAIAVRSFQRRD